MNSQTWTPIPFTLGWHGTFQAGRIDICMYLEWTPELLNEALESLTDRERAALDLFLTLTDHVPTPGEVRLKNFGFGSLPEYEEALKSARIYAKAFFAGHGITAIRDLPFHEPGISTDGRIEKSKRRKD